ncbi:MAG TPA: DNA recombinase [Microvirga sp.]|jgi:hypothetical protein|nr:DNA recombinase [Microvirga sp.]
MASQVTDRADAARWLLRAGFITTADNSDLKLIRLMDMLRHRDVRTVTGYVRRASLFKAHAGSLFL